MSFKKSLAIGALCTVAISGLAAQPAFAAGSGASTAAQQARGISSGKLSWNASTNAWTISGWAGADGGSANMYVSTDRNSAGKSYGKANANGDYSITIPASDFTEARIVYVRAWSTGSTLGIHIRNVDGTPITAPALSSVSSPSFADGAQGVATVKFSTQATGQLKYTAPTGTKIVATNYSGCVIAADGASALCGKDTDVWSADRTFTLEATGSGPISSTDGRVEVIKGGVVTDSRSFSATVKTAMTATGATINPGGKGTVKLTFNESQNASLSFTAPEGTWIESTNYADATISADHKSVSFGYQANWGTEKQVVLRVAADQKAGTDLTGGEFYTSLDGNHIVTAPFTVTVGDGTAVAPTITVPATTAGATSDWASATFPASDYLGNMILTAPEGTTFAEGRTTGSGAAVTPTISADGKTMTFVAGDTGTWGGTFRNAQFKLKVDAATAPGTHGGGQVVTKSYGNATSTGAFSIDVSLGAPTATVNGSTVSGTGVKGALVEIKDANGKVVASTTVKADGTWSVSVASLGSGTHKLDVTQTINGTTSPKTSVTAELGKNVTITNPSNGQVVSGDTVTFTGTGEPNAHVSVVSMSGKAICSTTVTASGSWTCDSTIELPNGDYTFEAQQAANGVTSSTTVTFVRKAVAPIATDVQFTSPTNDETLNTMRPVFAGTGEPGAAIRVHGTTKDIATTVVKADGTWTAPSTVDLQGDFRMWVEQTPANGAAKSSDEVIFHVRYVAANAVVVTSPSEDSTINSGYVTFTGTGDANAAISIEGTTKQIASTTVDEDGTWTARSTIELPKGDYRFTVKQDASNGDLTTASVLFHTK